MNTNDANSAKSREESMGDIAQSPYAGFLEMLCRNVLALQPRNIAVAAILPDGRAFTASYGGCGPYDLALMGFQIQADAMMKIVKANAAEIIQAAEQGGAGDDGA